MNTSKRTLLAVVSVGLLSSCIGAIQDLVDDLEQLAQDPQIVAAFSSATVQDALAQLDLSAALGGSSFDIVSQDPIGSGVKEASLPDPTPAFAPLLDAVSGVQECTGGLPSAVDNNLCSVSFSDGGWQYAMVWYYHLNWDFPADNTWAHYSERPRLASDNSGDIFYNDDATMYPAISIVELTGTLERPALGLTGSLSFTNLDHADYMLVPGYADVLTNNIQVTKTINFTKEDAQLKTVIESFKGNLNGAPDDDASLVGVNGLVDADDTAWYFSQYAEGRKGAKIFRQIEAAAGSNLVDLGKVHGHAVPGSYAEVVTPAAAGNVLSLSRSAIVRGDDDATVKEIAEFADSITAYRITTITTDSVGVYGEWPTKKGVISHHVSLARSGGTFTSTRTFPEGSKVATITETGTVSDDGSSFSRVMDLSDGTTVEEKATVALTRNADGRIETVTVTYDRGEEGTATIVATQKAFGFVDLSVDAITDEDIVFKITGTLDRSGAGDLTLEVDRPEVEPAIDISGTLVRSPDGSVKGTLAVVDENGEPKSVAVEADADAFNRLLGKARADARGTAKGAEAVD